MPGSAQTRYGSSLFRRLLTRSQLSRRATQILIGLIETFLIASNLFCACGVISTLLRQFGNFRSQKIYPPHRIVEIELKQELV